MTGMMTAMMIPMTITPTTGSLLNWLSPGTMQSLGWALLHFLWQGTALAAIAAGWMALSRRPVARYWIGVAALVLMLLAPLVTFLNYQNERANGAQSVNPLPAPTQLFTMAKNDSPAVSHSVRRWMQPASISATLNALPWLVEAWLLGVALFSLRSAGGFILVERERRKRSTVVSEHVLGICYELQNRLGIDRAIDYCECAWLQAPAVIGWFRPVVFLPATALTGLSEEQLQAVIAHELAHIQRLDPFVNVFQVGVETLLFYHPAVWWLNKRIRDEREHCCDETAVAICGNPVEYARALTLMEEWRSAPAFAMAANRGPLTERIVRVLGLKTLGAGMRGIGLTGSILCLAAALAAGNALLGMAHPKAALAAALAQATTKTSTTTSTAVAAGGASAKPSPAHPQGEEKRAGQATASSYIDAMKSAGLGDLTVDQLIALKIQDVTPEYVRGMQQLGLHPDAGTLIAMREQDITPEYIGELRHEGLNPNQDQLIGLKVQGADGAYYRGLKDAGIDPDIDQLIGLKVQGVTPEYVRELHAAGIALTADQVIGMKVQDVDPKYVKELQALGLQFGANELIGMRVQDVTPEWVRGIQALGLKPSTGELIGMRVQDVTPEYIKALQSAGFKVSVQDIIGAKVQDVTPEFIEQARKHGFKDLTLQKLIQLRQLGILESKADL